MKDLCCIVKKDHSSQAETTRSSENPIFSKNKMADISIPEEIKKSPFFQDTQQDARLDEPTQKLDANIYQMDQPIQRRISKTTCSFNIKDPSCFGIQSELEILPKKKLSHNFAFGKDIMNSLPEKTEHLRSSTIFELGNDSKPDNPEKNDGSHIFDSKASSNEREKIKRGTLRLIDAMNNPSEQDCNNFKNNRIYVK